MFCPWEQSTLAITRLTERSTADPEPPICTAGCTTLTLLGFHFPYYFWQHCKDKSVMQLEMARNGAAKRTPGQLSSTLPASYSSEGCRPLAKQGQCSLAGGKAPLAYLFKIPLFSLGECWGWNEVKIFFTVSSGVKAKWTPSWFQWSSSRFVHVYLSGDGTEILHTCKPSTSGKNIIGLSYKPQVFQY